jgi:hypothetical protein
LSYLEPNGNRACTSRAACNPIGRGWLRPPQPRGCRGAGVGWRWCAAAAQGPGRARAIGPFGSGRGLPGPQRLRLVRVLQDPRRDEEVRVDDHLKQAAVRFKRRFISSGGSFQAAVRFKRRFVSSGGLFQAAVRFKRRFALTAGCYPQRLHNGRPLPTTAQ